MKSLGINKRNEFAGRQIRGCQRICSARRLTRHAGERALDALSRRLRTNNSLLLQSPHYVAEVLQIAVAGRGLGRGGARTADATPTTRAAAPA